MPGFYTERAARTTESLRTKKSALFLQVQTLSTSQCLCCAPGAGAAPLLQVGAHWMGWHSPRGAGAVCVAQRVAAAAWAGWWCPELMSDSRAVAPGLPSVRAQLPQQQRLESCRGRSKGKKRDFFQAFWSQQQCSSLSWSPCKERAPVPEGWSLRKPPWPLSALAHE